MGPMKQQQEPRDASRPNLERSIPNLVGGGVTLVDLSAMFRNPSELDRIRRTRRPNRAEVEPRVLAVRALRSLGFDSVCAGELEDHANSGRMFSGSLSTATVVGLALSLHVVARFGVLLSFGYVIGAVVVLIALSLVDVLTPKRVLAVLVLAWMIAGVLIIVNGRSVDILLTHMLPFVVVLVARWCIRAGQLAIRIPLFIPAALVIVLAPLLTSDPWQFVAQAKGRLVWVAIIAIVPLLTLVLVKFWRIPLDRVFDRAADVVKNDTERSIAIGMRMLRSRCLTREHWPEPKRLRRFLNQSYSDHVLRSEVPQLRDLAASAFRRRCVVGFLTLLMGTSAITYVLIYLLAIVAVPLDLAKSWSQSQLSTVSLTPLPGASVELPLWPYTGVASLFSIVAAVGFLSFALTEETYTTALVDVVFGRLAQLLITIGAPFLFDGGKAKPAVVDSANDGSPTKSIRSVNIKNKSGRGSNVQRNH